MKMLFVLLLLASSASSLNPGDKLSNAGEFKNFVNNVNSGTNYSGTTVFLGSDITLSGPIDPIGINGTYQFLGTFDGQGHVISSLKMNTSSQHAGLFGYSTGLTIRNVVLGGSCSVISSCSGSSSGDASLGGIIGRCEASSEKCDIENSVNMADVTSCGSISSKNNLYIGGIVGDLYSWGHNVYVKNCVNYGSVTHSGTVSATVCLGGIAGISQGSSTYNYVQNCLNYGTITHNGASKDLAVGGIVGYGQDTYIKNCVSAGKISTPTTASRNNSIGSITGKVNTGVYINYSYYTNDVNASSINGDGTPSNTEETPAAPTDLGSDLVSKLNVSATSNEWDKWFVLHLNGGSIDNLTQEFLVEIQGHIPNPVKEGNNFLFWCKDAECNNVFDPETESVSGITDLYAGWAPNNYTVVLDANGGNVSKTSKVITFNKEYGKLPEPERTGYIFIGWFTNETNGTEVTNETTVITPCNHTLYARWEEVIIQVKIVFNTKNLTEEDVEKLIEQYTKAGFTITKFEKSGGSDEINVIIGFVNKDDADNFIENIKGSDEMKNIKKINFIVDDDAGSISTTTYPLLFLNVLFFIKDL